MYYHTPKVEKYIEFIKKYRLFIISTYLLLALIALVAYQPKVLSSDALFWLKESKELQRTTSKNYKAHFLSKLTIKIDNFDEKSKKELEAIAQQLSNITNVSNVASLFSKYLIESNSSTPDSEMLGVMSVGDLDVLKVKTLINESANPYCNFVDRDFHEFHYFIASQESIDIDSLQIKYKYSYQTINEKVNWSSYFIYAFVIFLVLMLFFRVMFQNYISAISATIVIFLTTVFTFTLIYILTGIDDIHIAMPFITISIAMVDYLYFYYRWHVSQYKSDKNNALIKMLNKNATPAFWTSIITILGLGSLVFIDSDIIKILSLSVIISSVLAYLINLTFLPSFLSFIELRHSHVAYAKLCYIFSTNELHYNKKFLFLFLTFTSILIAIGGYQLYDKSNNFFTLNVKNDQIELKIPYTKLDVPLIESLERFTEALNDAFEDDIGEVTSLSTLVNEMNDANSQTENLTSQALSQALFFIDMYGLGENYYNDNSINITLNLLDVNKLELIHWLANYENLELYFVDNETLLSSAKFNNTLLLATSLSTALLIIGIIMGWIFRSKEMILVGFLVNAIPIAWFGLMIKLLDIPLSLEVLIAMTISVGLASDATIHFAFKYFRSRYFGGSQKHALEKMFFYSGVPVIIGSIILAVVFAAFNFTDVHSLQLIGTYSAILIIMSLATDLFILPVMLLFIDKFDKKSI